MWRLNIITWYSCSIFRPSPFNHPCTINQPNDNNSPTNYPNNKNSGINPCIQQKPCNDIQLQQSSPPPSSHTSSSSSSSYAIVNPSDEDEEEDDGVQSGSDSGFSDSKNCPFKGLKLIFIQISFLHNIGNQLKPHQVENR